MNPLRLLNSCWREMKSFFKFWKDLSEEFRAHWRSYHVRQSLKSVGPYYYNEIRRMVELGDLTYDAEVEVELRKIPVSQFYLQYSPSIAFRVIQTIEIIVLLMIMIAILLIIVAGIFFLRNHLAAMISAA
ncbi:MAG: hypothetical protein AAF984_07765 [Verrucomicrobiota bacterium]